MLTEWLEDIRSVGIFLICAQLLIHFRPDGSYVKYLRLLVSIMILVQLLEPFFSLFGLLEKGQLQKRVDEMERKLMQIREEAYNIETGAEDIWGMFLEKIDIELLKNMESEESSQLTGEEKVEKMED